MNCLEIVQKRRWFAVLAIAALMIGAATQASAQGTPTSDVYLIATFNNNGNSFNYPQPIYIVNNGSSGGGTRCANIYVLDTIVNMIECCSCPIRANELLILSVKDLTSSSITSVSPKVGTIKIVSSNPGEGTCSATSVLALRPALRAWMSHIQIASTFTSVFAKGVSTPTLSVVAFDQSPLSDAESTYLPLECQWAHYLGSGKGVCSCPQTAIAGEE